MSQIYKTASASSSGVESVSGTLNRITITGTATDPIVDISPNYVGQTSITTVGTVSTGTWQGSTVATGFGGTGLTSPGSSGNLLTSNGTNWVSSPPSINSMVLIQTLNASNVPDLSFTSLPLYNYYLIVLNNIRPVTDGSSLLLRVSIDNGATYINTGYLSGCNWNVYNSASTNNVNNITGLLLCPNVDALAVPGIEGSYFLWTTPGNFTTLKGTALFNNNTSSLTAYTTSVGSSSNFTLVNALRFVFTAGNIQAGTVTIYGMVN